mmetsp:Transcript_24691/g.41170  ORF Transcript_24691/g.41170 Transcript_24691/m.41170 type:complete len:634 (-) Transcript_24691:82-1983(-)
MIYATKCCLVIGVILNGIIVSSGSSDINVLLIVADDLGYNDLSSYGSPTIETPNIDSIGEMGARFTQFYVGGSICTPSRSAMLTGRLPVRSGIYSALDPPADELFRVFYPTSVGCLPESEVTVADALLPEYATAMIGKWHLGHNKDAKCLPGGGNQGFEFFYGLPYSHEEGYPGPLPEGLVFPPVPLMTSDYGFIEQPFNESDLTSRYTSIAENLIMRFAAGQEKSDQKPPAVEGATSTQEEELFSQLDYSRPFFLHVGYENPHVPLFLGVDYDGTSRRGLYGDSVQEMDLSVGRLLDALKRGGLMDNTLVIFTSDNGAWLDPNNGLNSNRPVSGMGPFDGGSNAPFQGGKGSTWEGGFRVPLLVSLPAHIPPRRIVRTPVTAMDFLPTILEYAQIPLPEGGTLDGLSMRSLLEQGTSTQQHQSQVQQQQKQQLEEEEEEEERTGKRLLTTDYKELEDTVAATAAAIGKNDGKFTGRTSSTSSSSEKEKEKDLHDCIYLWREKDLYAIRCGQYKAHFITRSGFYFSDHGTVQDPPLLFNVEWDPAERLPLDTTAEPQYAAQLAYLEAQANLHVHSIVKAPSQYLAQNYSRVPCCPRDRSRKFSANLGMPTKVAVADKSDIPHPWEDCLCSRFV